MSQNCRCLTFRGRSGSFCGRLSTLVGVWIEDESVTSSSILGDSSHSNFNRCVISTTSAYDSVSLPRLRRFEDAGAVIVAMFDYSDAGIIGLN